MPSGIYKRSKKARENISKANKGRKFSEETKEKIRKKSLKHGMSGTKTYESWASMKARCLNPNHKNYKNYGGRGIVICECWLGKNGFQNFFNEMGEKPKGLSIDRIDNNKGYCKSNCRYATQKQQLNNIRRNRLLTYKNKTQNVTQWAEELGINRNTLFGRIRYGWSVKRILTNN